MEMGAHFNIGILRNLHELLQVGVKRATEIYPERRLPALCDQNESEDIFPFHCRLKRWAFEQFMTLALCNPLRYMTHRGPVITIKCRGLLFGGFQISAICTVQVYSGVQCPAQTWEAVAHQLERTQHIWIMQTRPCQLEKRWDPLRKWLSTANISRMWPPMSQ